MNLISKLVATVMALFTGVFTVFGVRPPLLAADTFTVYMSPTGQDTNDGLTTGTAVRTLARVKAILAATTPDSDVEVRITQGTYQAAATSWTFYVPGHTVTFLPIDYDYGAGTAPAGRPVFTGAGAASYWMNLRLPSGSSGATTGLRFYYLQVERYALGGININGGYVTNSQGFRVPSGTGLNGNTFIGNVFRYMGSKHNPVFGYAGLVLANSSNNVVQKNNFQYLENTGAQNGLIHGVYVEHGSSNNLFTLNNFLWVSGDAAHTRNRAYNNDFHDNRFERTSVSTGFYGEWFCDGTCINLPDNPKECASRNNLFIGNTLVSGYNGGSMPTVFLAPPGNKYPGGSGCPSLGSYYRVRVA